jgi:hypothetical protein
MHVKARKLIGLLIASSAMMASQFGYAQGVFASKTVTVMNETLSFGGANDDVDLTLLGGVQISYAISAIGRYAKEEASNSLVNDFSNAQLILQKNLGSFAYYIQAGNYLMANLAEPIARSSSVSNDYGFIPHAYVTYSFDQQWSLMVGKLLSMPGFENPFTYQNQNIQRGLLERHNNTISRGIQLNYKDDKKSFFMSLNDGFYSGKYSWIGVGGTYQEDVYNSTSMMWGGSQRANQMGSSVSPILQNNSQIFNFSHSLTSKNWSFIPYYQLTVVPVNDATVLKDQLSTHGLATILDYQFPQQMYFLGHSWRVNLPLRIERLRSSAIAMLNSSNFDTVAYTNARSVTFTPTFQAGDYFFRTEISHTQAISSDFFKSSSPTRVLFEVGILH